MQTGTGIAAQLRNLGVRVRGLAARVWDAFGLTRDRTPAWEVVRDPGVKPQREPTSDHGGSKAPGRTFTVFYVWQSDLQEESNRFLILAALRDAAKRLVNKPALGVSKIVIDEATRDASGSPYIPGMIANKILAADAVFCDVTTVLRSPEGVAKARASANPNVVFELGLAVAQHGWERVVLLFNEAHGDFPRDLPFDFDRHRASPFTSPLLDLAGSKPSASDLKAANERLYSMVYDAVKAIITSNPPRPADLRGVPVEQLKRNKDVATLSELLQTLHLPTLDDFLAGAPKRYPEHTLYFYEEFSALLQDSRFYLYDGRASDLIRSFASAWNEILSIGSLHMTNPNGYLLVWPMPFDLPFRTEIEQDHWDTAVAAVKRMQDSLEGLLSHLRDQYPEVDIHDASLEALRRYREYKRDLDEMIDRHASSEPDPPVDA